MEPSNAPPPRPPPPTEGELYDYGGSSARAPPPRPPPPAEGELYNYRGSSTRDAHTFNYMVVSQIADEDEDASENKPLKMSSDPLPVTGEDDFNFGGGFEFSEQSIRMGFIRKVYSILICQLLVTILFIVLFLYVEPLKAYCHENIWVFVVAMIATFVCLIVLACCPDVRRSYPANFIFLGIFTICEGFVLGVATRNREARGCTPRAFRLLESLLGSTYDADAVLMAVGVTSVVALGLTIFAMQTKWDFTMCSGGLLVLLIILMCFGLLCAFIQNEYANIAYACLGALVFAMYLVFDTQLMMGGKHKYSLSPEEYIFAALNLYLDIINLFLFILSLIGRR